MSFVGFKKRFLAFPDLDDALCISFLCFKRGARKAPGVQYRLEPVLLIDIWSAHWKTARAGHKVLRTTVLDIMSFATFIYVYSIQTSPCCPPNDHVNLWKQKPTKNSKNEDQWKVNQWTTLIPWRFFPAFWTQRTSTLAPDHWKSQGHPPEIGAQVTAMIRSQRKVPQEWGKSRPSQVALKLLLSSQLNVEVDILGTGLLTIWILHEIVLGHSLYVNFPTKNMPFCWIKMVELFPYSSQGLMMPTCPQTWLTPVEVSSQPCWDQFFWVQKHVWIFTPKMFFFPSFCGEIFCITFCNIQNLWNILKLPIFKASIWGKWLQFEKLAA